MSGQLRWGKTTFPSPQCVPHSVSLPLSVDVTHLQGCHVSLKWTECFLLVLSASQPDLQWISYSEFDIRVTELLKDDRTSATMETRRTSAQRQEASQKHLHVKTSVSQLYGLKDEGESTNTILNKSGVTHFATPHKKPQQKHTTKIHSTVHHAVLCGLTMCSIMLTLPLFVARWQN